MLDLWSLKEITVLTVMDIVSTPVAICNIFVKTDWLHPRRSLLQVSLIATRLIFLDALEFLLLQL